ncbi:hypothetical protein F5X68DRAFT_194727 [Plectosphaerella plurivora]|uniref:GLEYA adhesin domain-containing protein n=1 Tax=Plectosphaerella plurivora TaxID=936078 RepID=A0A9P8V4A4_9PEZI|nr:hypothetical protein F5X68DRAFT_194727 [Plectosphaerella plurivora]
MKTSATAAVLGLAGLAAAGSCNNNCGRAVTGTARKVPSLEDRESQCSAFLTSTTTITPPVATVTQPPIWQRNVHGPREVEAPTLTGEKPAYATNCADLEVYWLACQCFGITPTLVTEVAPTPTETILGPTCTQGLEFALYAPVAGSPAYANLEYARTHGLQYLDLSVLVGGAVPAATGVAPYVATLDGDEYKPIEVYGITGPAGSTLGHSILDHRGFLVPAVAGTYTATVPDADDAVFFWAGEAAVSGFEAGNAKIVKGYGDGPPRKWELVVREEDVGKAVAVRLLWANWAGRGVVELSIVDPKGKEILGKRTAKNREVLARCEGNLAPVPVWPAWEAEVVG